MIRLDNGQRLAVGTHLWEHGTSLRVNDGAKVAEIPLTARMRKAVLDYVDGLLAHAKDPSICAGRIDPVPRGLDDGWASVAAHDDQGGAAAILGMQIYRQITCDPEAQSSIELLSLFGKLGGRGPLRAKPRLDEDRFAASKSRPGQGGGGGEIAEHKQPPAKLPGQRRFSIRENEERGGHILERHVGKTEEQLKQRLAEEPHIPVASSFRDESTAEQAIAAAVEKNEAVISQWLKRPMAPLELQHKGDVGLGIAIDRSSATVRSSRVARVVLKPDARGGFYVLTAYLR